MLIFDLGAYKLDSTSIYLDKYEDCKIVALDANPQMIQFVEQKFKNYIDNDRLVLINKAITDKDGDIVDFYVQNNKTDWSSLYAKIAERHHKSEKISCETISIRTLLDTYGTPDYLKIDIEGADDIVIKDLKNVEALPKLISAETECLGNKDYTDGLQVINALKEIGYTKFVLENQRNTYIGDVFTFPYIWLDYNQCTNRITQLRYRHNFSDNYSFWYDVIASY